MVGTIQPWAPTTFWSAEVSGAAAEGRSLSPTPAATVKVITPMKASVIQDQIRARGMSLAGLRVSSAAMGRLSIAKKNQAASGSAAHRPAMPLGKIAPAE